MNRGQADFVVNKVSSVCFVCKDVSAILLRFSWKLQARRSRRQRCGFLSHLHSYWQQGTFTGITCFACSFCAEYLAVTQRTQWLMLKCVVFSCHVILSSEHYMNLTPKTAKAQWLKRSLSSSGEIDFLTTNQEEVQLKRTQAHTQRVRLCQLAVTPYNHKMSSNAQFTHTVCAHIKANKHPHSTPVRWQC